MNKRYNITSKNVEYQIIVTDEAKTCIFIFLRFEKLPQKRR